MNSETQIQIERLVFQGYGPKRLAKLFGGSAKRYRDLVRELGGARAKPFDMPDEKVIELWNLGYGVKRMARMFRCRNGKVVETFRRLGLQDSSRAFNTSHGARLAGALTRQRAEPGRIESMIMDGYKQESRALKQGDEQRHWADHPEVSRFNARNNYKERYAFDEEYRNKQLRKAAVYWAENRDNTAFRNKRSASFKTWKDQNKEYVRSYGRTYMREHGKLPRIKITSNLRGRLRDLLRRKGGQRSSGLIGCSAAQLVQHLEQQFKPGMTWENYGKHWHVDHIMPCSAFDLTIPEEQRECFHYSNLQPLESDKNMRKSDSWCVKY